MEIIKKSIEKYTVAVLLIVLVIVFGVFADGFLSWNNLFNLLRQISVLGIISFGLAMVVISGNVDMSVGSLVSFCSCVMAILVARLHFPVIPSCIIGIAICVLACLLNGIITLYTGMPSILCTLATMQIFQGFAYVITKGEPVSGLADSLRMIGQGYFGVIPIPVIIMAVVIVASIFIMEKTYVGRYFYAVGSNMKTARLSGIPVYRAKLYAFMFCGLCVGIASCIQMSRLFGGFPNSGSGIEMEAVTAIVVGGVSFNGGKGNLSGVILGVLIIGVLTNGLSIMGTNSYMQMVIKGIVLCLVVGIDCYRQKSNE